VPSRRLSLAILDGRAGLSETASLLIRLRCYRVALLFGFLLLLELLELLALLFDLLLLLLDLRLSLGLLALRVLHLIAHHEAAAGAQRTANRRTRGRIVYRGADYRACTGAENGPDARAFLTS